MSSIKTIIRLLHYSLITFFLSSCTNNLSFEEYIELCPYEFKYGTSHYLEIPSNIYPFNLEYKVGDTLTLSCAFSDSIYDLTRQTKFKIENFPFKPICGLYNILSESDSLFWESGFRFNEIIIDDKYNADYRPSSSGADVFSAEILYNNNAYDFTFSLVMEKPGTYIYYQTDEYVRNSSSGDGYKNSKADSIDFEGRCPDTDFYLCNVLKGEPNYNTYIEELIFFDENINRGQFSSLDENIDKHLGSGLFTIEWFNLFIFKVVE